MLLIGLLAVPRRCRGGLGADQRPLPGGHRRAARARATRRPPPAPSCPLHVERGLDDAPAERAHRAVRDLRAAARPPRPRRSGRTPRWTPRHRRDGAGAAAAHRDVQLKESFQRLGRRAGPQQRAFVTLAEGRLKEVTAALTAKADGDATARVQAINAMLDPMTVTLRRVEGQLHTVEKDRESAYAGLREQVTAMHRSSKQLQEETKQLVNALRARRSAAAGASCSWSGSSSWPAWSSTATSTSRSSPPARTAAPGRTWWCAWPATTDRGGRQGAVRGLPGGGRVERPGRAHRPAHGARPPAARARRLAVLETYWLTFEPSPEFVCCSCRATRSWRRRCGPTRR